MTLSPPRPFIAVVFSLFLATVHAGAAIGLALQMQLGNPSNATVDPSNHNHYLIQRSVEAIDYDDNLGEPNWASWDLTASDFGTSGRSSSFLTDTTLPPSFYEVTTGDYTNSGYDRGHMCPSADRTDNTTDNALVFYMSNIVPQTADNNQGPWVGFESYCRSLANAGDEVLIICGGSGYTGAFIPSGKAAIPGYIWKTAVVVPPGTGSAISRIDASTRVISIKIPNIPGIRSIPWTQYLTSANQIQVDTGLTFFTALPAATAAVLRAKVDGAPTPSITVSADTLTISQVYGGGGNSGATYKNDFIELYNAGTTTVNLSTYAVQYCSATGTTWQQTLLTGLLLPGHYFLVQEAQGTGGTLSLPQPQVIGTISMAASSGKVALTKTQTPFSGGNPLANSAVVDFVGYGSADFYEGPAPAPLLSSSTAAMRANGGATDANNNGIDFSAGPPVPHNGAAIDAWRTRTFNASELAATSVSGDLANPSGDGVSNLAKYAYNLDPHKTDGPTAMTYATQANGNSRTLTLTHRKNHFATDIAFSYEISSDLVQWTTTGVATPSVVVLDEQTDTVTVSATSSAPSLFIRVKMAH